MTTKKKPLSQTKEKRLQYNSALERPTVKYLGAKTYLWTATVSLGPDTLPATHDILVPVALS